VAIRIAQELPVFVAVGSTSCAAFMAVPCAVNDPRLAGNIPAIPVAAAAGMNLRRAKMGAASGVESHEGAIGRRHVDVVTVERDAAVCWMELEQAVRVLPDIPPQLGSGLGL